MKENAIFVAKVAVAILLISQVEPLRAFVNKNYFASA